MAPEKKDLEQAIDIDMRGCHDDAVTHCTVILAKLNRSEDVEAYDAVFVRFSHSWTTRLTNARPVATKRLEMLSWISSANTAPPNPRPRLDQLPAWHLFSQAEGLERRPKALRPLAHNRDESLQVAANHQLAATDIEEAERAAAARIATNCYCGGTRATAPVCRLVEGAQCASSRVLFAAGSVSWKLCAETRNWP